jgi:hypothetical protein
MAMPRAATKCARFDLKTAGLTAGIFWFGKYRLCFAASTLVNVRGVHSPVAVGLNVMWLQFF